MKKRLLAILTAILVIVSCVSVIAAETKNDKMTAVWISTVYGSCFPKTKTAVEQKKEFEAMLDRIVEFGINTVVVQVRPKADALYESDINPWSDVLGVKQGEYPGYDPLEFMIEAAHKRGLKLHAWLNPYRITTSGTDLSVLCDNHPAKENPDWVIEHNNALYYDPANEGVKNYICDTVKEIVDNYDVDGIHFDDYFYPNGYPLSEGEQRDGDEANQRREHVNDLIKRVSRTIKKSGRDVLFGVSPQGVCVNEETGKYGSVIRGNESMYTIYADPRVWIENEWIDYVVPQVYWEMDHKTAAFETVVNWWQDQVKGTNVDLYIGHGLYKDVVAKEITAQLEVLENKEYVDGSFFYNVNDLINNRQGCGDAVKAYFTTEKTQELPNFDIPEVIEFEAEAIYSKNNVLIDNAKVSFEAYNIGGYTYFKLRDVAMALTGTAATFDVGWDAYNQTISVEKGKWYTPAGGELEMGSAVNKRAVLSSAKLSLDGIEIAPMAYNINGNNFFKLRDLGAVLGFDVDWSEANKTIVIYTE